MITTSSLVLDREDGSKLYIEIEPVSYEDHGAVKYTGVYHLQASRYDDPFAANTEDNPGDTIDAGTFAHKEDDPYEWVYEGDLLTDDEQQQLAAHIQGLDRGDSDLTGNEENGTNESFYVQAYYHGGLTSFEVTPTGHSYLIAYDGQLIAELQHNEDWMQISGKPLDEDVFVSIKQSIEAKYD